MDTLFSMRVFCAVVEAGSFVGASERLDISAAMTTKHVMHLERHLGVRLLHRTSRRMHLTEAGQLYHERCTELLAELEELENATARASTQPRGVLRVTGPVWLGVCRFARALAAYRQAYPEVLVDLNLTDRVVDLVEEGLDLALRVTLEAEPREARALAEVPFCFVASPAYLDEVGRPASVADLTGHRAVVYTYAPPHALALGTPTIRCNNTVLLHQAALAGMGLAMLPEWLIADDLEQGRLQRILAGVSAPSARLYAVYASRRQQSSKVRTFVEFLQTSLADE